MAEIRVERRERSSWPWVVGFLLVVGVVWYTMGRTRPNMTASGNRTDSALVRDSAAGTLPPPQSGNRDSAAVPPR